MMELNTDRMLFAIGAVILGAVLLFGVITGYPGMMSMWGFGMADSVNNVEIAAGSEIVITNNDFSAYSQGWEYSGDAGSVVFDGNTAYISENERIYTKLTIPNNSEIRVTFKARGLGKVRTEISSNDSISTSSEMSLSSMDQFHTYRATLRKTNDSDDYLVFAAPAGSEVIIDDISVDYMGVIEGD